MTQDVVVPSGPHVENRMQKYRGTAVRRLLKEGSCQGGSGKGHDKHYNSD
jgi:hypothetical protein